MATGIEVYGIASSHTLTWSGVADIASRRTCPDVGLYRAPVRIIVAATRDASDARSIFYRLTYHSANIATELVA